MKAQIKELFSDVGSIIKGTILNGWGNAGIAVDIVADRRGLIAYLMAGVVGAVMLIIGAVISFSVRNGISQVGWTSSQNTTMTSLDTNIGTAWTVGGISLLVVFAAGILRTLRGSF